jgi:hypothetical protein
LWHRRQRIRLDPLSNVVPAMSFRSSPRASPALA